MHTLALRYTAAATLTGAFLVGATIAASAATPATEPSVLAFDQKPQSGHVILDYAYLPAKGYAVVYGADKEGKPVKEPLGHVELNAGDHRGVKIKLNNEPAAGSKVWISLYQDKDAKPGFDRQGDAPFWTGALPAENSLTIR